MVDYRQKYRKIPNRHGCFLTQHFYRETCVIVNKSVNEFYTRFLFKIYSIPQDFAFPLEITATFLKKSSPGVREFLISEGVQVPPRHPTEDNSQGNQRLLLVMNATVESEKNTRKIKTAVQAASGSRHPKKSLGTLVGNPSTQMDGFSSSFKFDIIKDSLRNKSSVWIY